MTFSVVQPRIQEWVASDPRVNFSKVIQFAVLTIQQPFHSIAKQIDDVNTNGINSRFVWGNKRKTFQWLEDHKGTTHDIYQELDGLTDDEALGIIMEIPGLGVAKAGFVLQMTKGRVGCLDSHNLNTIYNLKGSYKGILKGFLKDSKLIKDNKIHIGYLKRNPKCYTSICNSIGSKNLWDNWCTFIDTKYPNRFVNLNSSEYHWSCLQRII